MSWLNFLPIGNESFFFFALPQHLIMSCKHRYIQLYPSPFAELAGYEQPNATTCKAAESSGQPPKRKTSTRPIDTFPGPLVLPHDDLNYNPDCPHQDFESWISLKQRNSLSIPTRENLYVVQAPIITEDREFMKEWSIPQTHRTTKCQV